MALGATIYKTELNVADTDRHYYGSHFLTVARHPSEKTERMMVRLIAFALNAHEDLAFTKGISTVDEPDIWLKDLTGAIEQWIEVGQPSESRLLKACGRAEQVIVYCHNGHASRLWWDTASRKLARVNNLKIVCLPVEAVRELAADVKRNMTLHVNVQEQELFISNDNRQVSLTPDVLQDFKA